MKDIIINTIIILFGISMYDLYVDDIIRGESFWNLVFTIQLFSIAWLLHKQK